MNSIISVFSLKKSYFSGNQEVPVLKDIFFEINEGDIVAIMGRSGSGKTTLLNCISALDSFDFGKILISGKDIQKLSDNKKSLFRARNVGFIFQSFNLIPVLTAIENVEIPLLLAGKSIKEAKILAETALEKVELSDKFNSKPSELSGGQQQRVAIARAIAGNPKIIFGDELTGNLDSKTEDKILELIKKLNEEEKLTFVLVTHSEKVSKFCDRVLRIEDGIIVK
jgi:putative ABC transport system ATP-binding protein